MHLYIKSKHLNEGIVLSQLSLAANILLWNLYTVGW